MEFEIGIACGACDTYNPIGTARCLACGNDLALVSRGNSRTNPNFRAVPQPEAERSATTEPAGLPAEPLQRNRNDSRHRVKRVLVLAQA